MLLHLGHERAAVGHRDLERVVDRRQVAVEHGVEHDALDFDDPPGGTVLSGQHALLRQLSRGARTVPEASAARAEHAQQACGSRRTPRVPGRVTKSGRRARRAVDQAPVHEVARVPADDDLGRPHDAGLGRGRRRRRVPAGRGDSEHGSHRRRGDEAAGPQREARDGASACAAAPAAVRRAPGSAGSCARAARRPRPERATRRSRRRPRGARRARRARHRRSRRPRPWRSTAGPSRRAAEEDRVVGVQS